MSRNKVVENEKLTLLGRFVIPWAIKHRNKLVLKYVKCKNASFLDIGGGKGYLIKNCVCRKAISVDEQGNLLILRNEKGKILKRERNSGLEIRNYLPFDDNSFDYVSMVAVIEHLKKPEKIVQEVHRVLKHNGLLIMTTPFRIVERVLSFLDMGSSQLRNKKVHEEHENYFNLSSMNNLTKGFKLLVYRKFELGINQLFVYKKVGDIK